MEELLTYDYSDFNVSVDSQKTIYDIKKSYQIISDAISNGCDEVILQDIVVMDKISEKYEKILIKYLEDHGKRGKLTSSIKVMEENNIYFNYRVCFKKYTYSEKNIIKENFL